MPGIMLHLPFPTQAKQNSTVFISVGFGLCLDLEPESFAC